MAAYIAAADITPALVTTKDYLAALDDDKDGTADAGLETALIDAACDAVDAALGGAVDTPLDSPYPAVAVEAAKAFLCELLWARRGVTADSNPWRAKADAARETLRRIADGSAPLSADLGTGAGSITDPGLLFDYNDEEDDS